MSVGPLQGVMTRECRDCGLGQGGMKKAELFVSVPLAPGWFYFTISWTPLNRLLGPGTQPLTPQARYWPLRDQGCRWNSTLTSCWQEQQERPSSHTGF